jgi:hypothetical protein
MIMDFLLWIRIPLYNGEKALLPVFDPEQHKIQPGQAGIED